MQKFVDNNFENLVLAFAFLVLFFLIYNILTLIIFGGRKIYLILSKNRKIQRQNIEKNKISILFEHYAKDVLKFRKLFFFGINLVLIILSIVIMYLILYPLPKVVGSSPQQNSVWENPEDFLEVEFSRPINVDKLAIHLAPDVIGDWRPVKTFSELPVLGKIPWVQDLSFVTKMRFFPVQTVMPDEKVIIYAVGYNPKTIGETMIEFTSPASPNVSSCNVEENSITFPLDGNIEFQMDLPIGDFVEWEAVISPETEYSIEQDKTRNVIGVSPLTRLRLDTDYSVNLFRRKVSYNISDKSIVTRSEKELVSEQNFHTDNTAVVASVEPTGNLVLIDRTIVMQLGKILDHAEFEKSFRIEPEIAGNFNWTSDQEVVFTPDQPLEKATKYNLIIGKGLNYGNSIQTKTDIVFDFETIGYVIVSSFNVPAGTQNLSVSSNIEVNFNQEVDKASAEADFQISPSVAGTFSWQENKMIFNPGAYLGYSTSYTVKVKSGVKSVNGLDSKEEFSTNFVTAPNIFKISVPYYTQVKRFECELLALKMALAYRGVYLSADQIMNYIGVSSVPYDSANNTWGDPNTSFVGDVTGGSKGYGVHLDPLAGVARGYGRAATVKRGWNVSGIAQEVSNGNPVVILWQNGWSAPTNISWNTPEGKYIYAINGTHAGVVVGFQGPAENPTSMIVQDPWYRGGSQRTYSISSFNSLWSYHGYSALIIY